jgi:hypothetical protein
MGYRLAAKTSSGDTRVGENGKMPGGKCGPLTFWCRSKRMKTPEECYQFTLVPLQGFGPSLKLRIAKRSN